MLLAVALLCVGCSDDISDTDGTKSSKKPGSTQVQQEEFSEIIASIGADSVEVEIVEIYSQTGRAAIKAQVPDYTTLFSEAIYQDDPTGALEEAILKGDFPTVSYEGTATVTTVDGEQVVDYEEAVKDFIEQELIKAINTILEVEE